jgi:putative ABC transport system ATP-binding protein
MLAHLFHRDHAHNGNVTSGDGAQPRPLIELRKIIKTYKTAAGEFPVLKGIDCQMGAGEFIGVIGRSGSGKSTLINMITGIDRPTSGEIFVGETAVHKLSENQMAIWRGRNLGVVFQFFQLLPMLTLLDNIMLPMDFCGVGNPHRRRDRAMALLEMVGLEAHADKLPSAVSGGQQQRAAIARALANDPPIVIADEPTGNLDSRTAESVFQMFETLVGHGKTILMVTHDASLAKRVSRTLLIADGEIVNEYVARALPSLNDELLLKATHQLQPIRFAPGETLIRQGAPGDRLYIITRGQVEVALTGHGGDDVVVAHMGPGQYTGEIELRRNERSIATVRATRDAPVEAVALDAATFGELVGESEDTRKAVDLVVAVREQENAAARQVQP